MGDLIDLLLGNPFLILIILGGLYSMFKGGNKPEAEDENEVPAPVPKKSNDPFGREEARKKQAQVEAKQHSGMERTESYPNDQLSIEDQRQQQMLRLSRELASSNEHSGLKGRPKVADERRRRDVNDLVSSYEQERFQKEFKQGLTRRGIINSVVMAEVLGQPRARNPYESVIAKRKSK